MTFTEQISEKASNIYNSVHDKILPSKATENNDEGIASASAKVEAAKDNTKDYLAQASSKADKNIYSNVNAEKKPEGMYNRVGLFEGTKNYVGEEVDNFGDKKAKDAELKKAQKDVDTLIR
ncbi:hypothetical protein HK099_000893 [Clydaea vesicula]|uniref:Uncharacterized protein n=1 Tax=Clydaea vesicula TaxID=447962 RepID=A0AAD5XVA5_9FUNG|nr:hypothetical protein HK099_000893 [Clydaea vesicula]KAJ3377803.1 hypothetical protein HDU92_007954 [Lobulomyces angularis]